MGACVDGENPGSSPVHLIHPWKPHRAFSLGSCVLSIPAVISYKETKSHLLKQKRKEELPLNFLTFN